jgi:hypothetical protein
MLRNGSYSTWFRTPQGEGTGIVVLSDGKLTGGDTVLAYAGTYFQNGDRFSASVRTQRHTPGQPSVFGIDAGTDEAGHAFQFEAGRVFRSEAGHPWRQSHGSI